PRSIRHRARAAAERAPRPGVRRGGLDLIPSGWEVRSLPPGIGAEVFPAARPGWFGQDALRFGPHLARVHQPEAGRLRQLVLVLPDDPSVRMDDQVELLVGDVEAE